MTNVVHFPTKEVKIDKIKDYLDNAMETLEENYQLLDQLHQGLHVMEKASDELEQAYDVALKQYIDEVGIENVPQLMLSYSSNVLCKVEGEEMNCEWVGEEDDY